MNDVIKNIKKEIKDGETIVVATSGGPDSITLLNILLNIKKYRIICAHVNHKLRKESEEEAKMVEKLCTSNNITYEYYEIKGYKNNIENYAREKRYEFFDKTVKKYQAKYLLTAHHGDDLIETIIMRIIKGTDISELKGFSEKTRKNNYIIYRPLITVTKDEILDYCKNNKLKYAVDKSNEKDLYTRNRIRKYILTELKKENQNIHKNFLKISKSLEQYENYIDKNINKEKIINIKKFKNEEEIIKDKTIYDMLKKAYEGNTKKIKEIHIKDIKKLIENDKPNIKLNLPKNKVFIKEYDKAFIKNYEEEKEYDIILDKEIKLPNKHIIKMIEDTEEKSNNVLKINSKDIELPIHVRNKKNGDKLNVKNLKGTKKVKDIFIDEKIPVEERKNYPIVTDNKGEIIWLPGIKKSHFDVSKNKNYDIIIKYF